MVSEKFVMRLIRHKDTLMVNICDEELLGKIVKGKGLEINISEFYFGNDRINLNEALNIIKKSHTANLVGKRIVEQTLKTNLASKLAVKKIGSTLFLMIFKFDN